MRAFFHCIVWSALAATAFGCGSSNSDANPTPTDSGSTADTAETGATDPCGDPVDAAPVGDGPRAIRTVFIVMMENQNWADIKGSALAPYINSLLAQGAHAEQYFNPPGNHPSEPNYIWLESGSNLNITTDDDPSTNAVDTKDHLVSQLEAKGVTWKSYQENIDGTTCPLKSSGLYAAKHDPMVFFDDVTDNQSATSAHCIAHLRPYTELATDLTGGTVAQYNFITPNLCDDMHGDPACGNGSLVVKGDTWLSTEIPKILASDAYKNNGVLFITWDEGELSDGPIGMIVMSPLAKVGYSNTLHYDHSSTLRTFQEIFQVPFLRCAATAQNLSDLFQTYP